MRGRGRARVEGDRGPLARLARRFAGLPAPVGECAVELEIQPVADGFAWRRRFGGFTFATVQRPVGERFFRERVGRAELFFELEMREGWLLCRHRATELRVGQYLLPLPGWLAPRVAARDGAGGPGGVRFEVEVTWLGRIVVRYAGELELCASSSPSSPSKA